ncbi:hypothetical protein H0H81_005211 [Sphagnurus paluster]|uniref:Xylanolytic transcriptional activator regulatory domain-containing protein n=1 Tax=Sphagnurus paluster TaxID=117069 RepID=A0A9P7KMA6_9AGAR|nr:hypothetical protein H0H81_005211 [Sphagnurus paluster]
MARGAPSLTSFWGSPVGNPDARPTQAWVEPPVNQRRELFASHIGFFLDHKRTFQSMMLPLLPGDPSRPSPALTCIIYLWALREKRTSQSSWFTTSYYQEYTLKKEALKRLCSDVARTHPRNIMHTIQAEVLLSQYFLVEGKHLQSSHHASLALSLSLAAGLHHIPTSISKPAYNSNIPPPQDVFEEGERIDAFWAVYAANVYSSAIQRSPSMLQHHIVDTPWPIDALEHEQSLLPLQSHGTISDFFNGNSTTGFSNHALYKKAIVLLDQAMVAHSEEQNSELPLSISAVHLSSLLDTLQSTLPPTDHTDPAQRRLIATTYLLVHATRIILSRQLERQDERWKSRDPAAINGNAILNVESLDAYPIVDYVIRRVYANINL